MSRGVDALLGTFGMTDYLMPLVLADLTDEDARTRARGEEGPSITWIVGHLLHYRLHVMSLLDGVERDDPYAECFADTPATDGCEYPTVAELRERWDQVSDDFTELLASQTDASLDRPAAGPHEEESVRDQVVFYAWHEGYHMGAIGALLKAMGYAGPAERVTEARHTKAPV